MRRKESRIVIWSIADFLQRVVKLLFNLWILGKRNFDARNYSISRVPESISLISLLWQTFVIFDVTIQKLPIIRLANFPGIQESIYDS